MSATPRQRPPRHEPDRMRLRIPPPPRGLPRRLHGWYWTLALLGSVITAITVPMCPVRDRAGRPAWRVETVHDGDTVTCRDEKGGRERIRLVGIDAPEHGQPYGDESRAALAAKLAGGVVRVEGQARDQHQRLLGRLWVDDQDVNLQMVAEGWAWAFTGYAGDDDLEAAEATARTGRRGLWADPHPLAPSQWRATHPGHSAPGRR